MQVISGAGTGALGSAISNPIDVVRTRLQADSAPVGPDGRYASGLAAGKVPRYTGTLQAFGEVYRAEGFRKGLYRGTSATMARAICLSGAQLSTYDQLKLTIKAAGHMEEGTPLHLLSAFLSGYLRKSRRMHPLAFHTQPPPPSHTQTPQLRHHLTCCPPLVILCHAVSSYRCTDSSNAGRHAQDKSSQQHLTARDATFRARGDTPWRGRQGSVQGLSPSRDAPGPCDRGPDAHRRAAPGTVRRRVHVRGCTHLRVGQASRSRARAQMKR
jgi:hypothetical protein